MTKKPSQFEEAYFKGNKSTYTTCYDYKAQNIELVYRERALNILQKFVPKGAKVLDLGCAFGDLLALLDQSDFKTYGIDVSKYALEKAKKRTKAQLSVGDLNKKFPYKDNFFDAVFALDIIEHLESPYNFLIEIRRVLKKGGIVCIQTPNIGSIFEKISKEKWFGYRDKTHLYLFTRRNLQFLLKKSGFSVIYSETFASPFPSFVRTLLKNTDIGGNLWLVSQKT